MKGYLINPYNRSINEVEYDGNYKSIHTLIGASTFDVARLTDEGDAVFVDDEGLLTMTDETMFFGFSWGTGPLAGKGLILGVDEEGASTAPQRPIEFFADRLKIFTMEQVRSMYGERF